MPVAICATGIPGIVVPSAPRVPTNSFEFHFPTFLLITKDGENNNENRGSSAGRRDCPCRDMRNRRTCHRWSKRPHETPAHEFVSFSNLSFNHKRWGKTTTKTDAALVAGHAPAMIRATGAPVTAVEPSAPTKHPHTNSFHFPTFLLITKDGEKQQRKPRLSSW